MSESEAILTCPEEFKKFHTALMSRAPKGYEPYYFPLTVGDKDPRPGVSWKKNRKTFKEALALLTKGINIGIAATDTDQLVIVDVDNIDLVPLETVKPTLTVISRRRVGRHHFYFTNDPLATSCLENSAKQNIPADAPGEVRAAWQYVVVAGSFVHTSAAEKAKIPEGDRNNAGRYSVFLDIPPATITYEELPAPYRDFLEQQRDAEISASLRKESKKVWGTEDEKNRSKLWSLTIRDVTGVEVQERQKFASLLHDSSTEKNTSIGMELMHCWRHNVSHNALTYLAVCAGLSTCSLAGFGHKNSSASNIDLTDPETVYTLWNYAREHEFIPPHDPMPARAMVFYALDKGLCSDSDITDGWKLPIDVYNKVVEKAPYHAGREPISSTPKTIRNAIKQGGLNPEEVANVLQENYPVWYDQYKIYWLWDADKSQYVMGDDVEVLKQVDQGLGVLAIHTELKRQLISAIQIRGRGAAVEPKKPTWVQFKNTVYDLSSGKEFKASPKYFFTSPIPHNLGETEDTPTIDRIFKEWCPEEYEHLVEICAYCFLEALPIQKLFYVVGTGGNGKSQFMRFLSNVIGRDNCTTTDLERLTQSRFEVSSLYKKKICFIAETDYATLTKTSLLKRLTGDDTVKCEFKGKLSFDFWNTAKIIIATNGLPESADSSDGWKRRQLVIKFDQKFKDGKSVVSTIPEWEYENFCRKCMRVLRQILEEGEFRHAKSLAEMNVIYKSLSNPVGDFIQNKCILDFEAWTPFWVLFEAFNNYRQIKKVREYSEKAFSKSLEDQKLERGRKTLNFEQKKTYDPNASDGDSQWYGFYGIRLKEPYSSLGSDSKIELEKVANVLESQNKNDSDGAKVVKVSNSISFYNRRMNRNVIPLLLSLQSSSDDGTKQILESDERVSLDKEKYSCLAPRLIEFTDLGLYLESPTGKEYLYLDIETTGLDPYTDNLVTFQVMREGREPVITTDIGRLAELKNVLEQYIVVGANLKFDAKFLKIHCGLDIKTVFDVILAEKLLIAGLHDAVKVSLQTLTKKYCNVTLDKSLQTSFEAGKAPTQEQLEYAAKDLVYLPEIVQQQLKQIKEKNLEAVLKIEMECLPAVVWLELSGIKVNTQKIDELQTQLEAQKNAAEEILIAELGAVNFNSPTQLLQALRDKGLNLRSTSEGDLAYFKGHRSIDALLQYREANKFLSTYINKIPGHINQKTGRIHADFWQAGTKSGRFSSANPNLQNQPNGFEWRSVFVPEPGNKFIVADYSQIELRIAGQLAKDPDYIKAYTTGEDLHLKTAIQLYKLPADATKEFVGKTRRNIAKTVNFALNYGMSAYSLKNRIKEACGEDITKDQAEEFIRAYQATYPAAASYFKNIGTIGVQTLQVKTLAGRLIMFEDPRETATHILRKELEEHYLKKVKAEVRALRKEGSISKEAEKDEIQKRLAALQIQIENDIGARLPDKIESLKGFIRRESKNLPVQGLCADMLKIALARIRERVSEMGVKLCNIVHDEIVLEAPEGLANEVAQILEKEMVAAGNKFLTDLPCVVETKVTDHWEH